MKYTKSNPPIVCMQTNSTCYKGTYTMQIKGVLWHSTGANNPNIKRYVQSSDNDVNKTKLLEIIGTNSNKNDWNHIEQQAGLNAWVGKLADGSVSCVQTMPWNYRPWGCGSGNLGSCNTGWIQFEICEDNLSDASYFNKVYQEACELTAYLCTLYNLNPYGTTTCGSQKNVPVILCHADAHDLQLGSDHIDVRHWFKRYGKDMNNVRDDVAKLMGITKSETPVAENKTTILRKGSNGTEVKKLQENLIKLGYDCGSAGADGDFGSGTENAVRKFQKDHNLTADGIVGSATYAALEIALQEINKPALDEKVYTTLSKGSSGPTVKTLQENLLQIGYYLGNYGADGSYGDATVTAVRKFQKDNSLSIDGVAGPATLSKVDEILPIAQQEQKTLANKLKQIKTNDYSIQPIVNWAENERNYAEKDSLNNLNDKSKNAGDDNYTKYAQEIDALKVFSAKVQGQPWCATWVTDGFINTYGVEKGLDMLCQPHKNSNAACCEDGAIYYQKAGRWYTSPQVGDQVFFKTSKYNYAHTGIVVEVTNSEVTTIEGNTSSEPGVVYNGGAVTKKHYPINYTWFKGFGRPKYEIKQDEDNFTPYIVRITANALNVRSGPDTNYPVTMVLKKGGAYTIVEEKDGFGLLKSKAGWISLQYTEKVK